MESPHFPKPKNIANPNVEKELRTRLCYEKMLADVSSLAISVKDLGEFMDSCLERMGKSYDSSRIYIYKRKPNPFIKEICGVPLEKIGKTFREAFSPRGAHIVGCS